MFITLHFTHTGKILEIDILKSTILRYQQYNPEPSKTEIFFSDNNKSCIVNESIAEVRAKINERATGRKL